jgi:hypothetical protein
MDRFPFSTSETTLLDPNTGVGSRCRKAPIFVDAGLPHILGFVVFLRAEGGVVEVVLQESYLLEKRLAQVGWGAPSSFSAFGW